MNLGAIENLEKRHFNYYDRITEASDLANIDFRLHNHEHYEIYLFLEGDANYIIEEKSYPLEPCDLIFIKKNEFHQVFHNSYVSYRRSLLWIDPLFFQAHHCEIYEEKFLDTSPSSGSKIPASVVRSNGIYDVFMKFKTYTKDYTDMDTPVFESLVVELLHLIHHSSPLIAPLYSNNVIQPVISYLNQNFTQAITLDMLQERFFISKYYLCRKFHEATGLSVHQYIRKKRLAKARELKMQGGNLGDIATKVGFSDYSSFYRAYQKEFDCTPKEY